MTYMHYYATTSRNLDRVMQYFVFPLAKAAGLAIFHNCQPARRIELSSNFARISSAAVYALLTTSFLGAESDMIDQNSRLALSAELGIDPKRIKFSDFKYSDNAIIRNAHQDMMQLQWPRYITDAMFMLPIAMKYGAEVVGAKWIPHSREVNSMINRGEKLSLTQLMFSGHNAWDFSVLAGKAAYWAGETYLIDKSGHYEIVKLIETLSSTGKDMSFNDLLGVYQRTRSNDQKLNLIDTQQEYDAIRPLLTRMADAYNKHDGKFGIPEIVYLIGLNKINIHGPDNKTVSEKAIAASQNEIDKVLSTGLTGIREEKRKLREVHGLTDRTVLHHKSFADRFGDTAVGVAQSFLNGTVSFVDMFRGKKERRTEEWTSVRNPGELAGSIGGHNISR